jgi:outer membrane autotransporter protein
LAGLAFVGARGSWLPDHSYESAEIALSGDILSDDVLGRSRAVFAGIDGAWLRVDNDSSRVDIDGMNLMIGYAGKERKDGGKDEQGNDKQDSSLLWAAFFDIGRANYDTYDNFDFVTDEVIGDIYGDGTLRSYGIGFMARKQWEGGFRVEGSLRGGKLKNEFTARNYVWDGVPLSYTVDAPYYGLHLGVGKTFVLNNPRDRVDLLLRYYWNRQDGDRVTLPDENNTWIDFGHDDSHRVRFGARYTRAHDYRRSWYIGAAIEHEFSGGIHARTKDFTLPAYDLSGTTGIGEIGVIIRPDRAASDDHNYSLEAGIQGYAGQYSGFSAGLRFEWEF